MSKRNSLRLNHKSLRSLPAEIRVPAYDRQKVTQSMMHIGVGSFHRAHQAYYADELLQQTGNTEWGYCGVGLLAQDARMRDALVPQDCLYTVIERGSDQDTPRVIGSLLDYLYAPQDMEAVLNKLAQVQTRIVTLTITEGGYYVNDGTGEFDHSHPDIVHDLRRPQQPRYSFGVLVEALDRRRKRGLNPFAVMSCDNLQHNGDRAKQAVLAVAEQRDPTLASWIGEYGTFPNSMVDRITPATTEEHRALLYDKFGYDDAWPVVTEPFLQWVVEDKFPEGRPNWEDVGVQMTSDVLPYEKIKLRLLNAGHQAICYIGMLLGYQFAHEAMQDSRIHELLTRTMDAEVTPLLTPPTGIDLTVYKSNLVERFSNPSISDQLPRIGTEGSARIPTFVLPSIAEALKLGFPVKLLSFTVAAWFRYLRGTDDAGRQIPINDPMGEELQKRARMGGPDANPLLGVRDLFGDELPRNPKFADEVRRALASFYSAGAEATLADYVGC